jgi:hypothetical protein
VPPEPRTPPKDDALAERPSLSVDGTAAPADIGPLLRLLLTLLQQAKAGSPPADGEKEVDHQNATDP